MIGMETAATPAHISPELVRKASSPKRASRLNEPSVIGFSRRSLLGNQIQNPNLKIQN